MKRPPLAALRRCPSPPLPGALPPSSAAQPVLHLLLAALLLLLLQVPLMLQRGTLCWRAPWQAATAQLVQPTYWCSKPSVGPWTNHDATNLLQMMCALMCLAAAGQALA